MTSVLPPVCYDESGYRWLLDHSDASVYDGDLTLAGMPIHTLPNGFTVNGNLDLSYSGMTVLPCCLRVNGDLNISHTKIFRLPDDLVVKGSLDISRTSINSLPDNLIVNRDLCLFGLEMTKLPRGLVVKGDLSLCDTGIAHLPADLSLGGGLDIGGTPMEVLPDWLFVNGTLDLSHTLIEKLPAHLIVREDLVAYEASITYFSEDIRIGRNIILSGSLITTLPENLIVNGDLRLDGSSIIELPRNLTVKGELDIRNTSISVLPEGLIVDKLFLDDNTLSHISENITINGNLDLSEQHKLKELPRNLRVLGSLDLAGSNISRLSSGLEVGVELNLMETSITTLPPDLFVGYNLYLAYLPLTEIPPTITVLGSIYLNRSPIHSIPEGLHVGENLWLNFAPNITELPKDIFVGGTIYIRGTPLAEKEKRKKIKLINDNREMNIDENQANEVVFLSALLKERYPDTCGRLTALLEEYGIPCRFLQGTRDIWCRDYMPVQTASGKLVQFRYEPSYLKGKPEWEASRTDPAEVCRANGITPDRTSDINLDGGNVLLCEDRAVISDRTFMENPDRDKQQLLAELADLLEAEIIVIPAQKGDMTGHADGMVRFINRDTLLGNDRATEYKYWAQGIDAVLQRYRMHYEDVPFFYNYKDPKHPHHAIGIYVNYLQVGNLLVLPVFNVPGNKDAEALARIRALFPARTVVPFNCNDIALEGGLLNCITWTLRN